LFDALALALVGKGVNYYPVYNSYIWGYTKARKQSLYRNFCEDWTL